MKHAGYTLVEVLIVIGIIASIAVIGVPITGRWVQGADIEQTQGLLSEAVGRAKASGIRNKSGSTGTNQAAIICISNVSHTLRVLESTSATPATCVAGNTATVLWQKNMDEDVAIKDSSDTAISCICMNNKGLPFTTAAGTCSTCYSGNSFKIVTGNTSETTNIF